MWRWVVGYQAVQIVLVVVIATLSLLFWDRRYKKRKNQSAIPEGFERTEEVSYDPTSGVKQRVYYKKETGERIYVEEK